MIPAAAWFRRALGAAALLFAHAASFAATPPAPGLAIVVQDAAALRAAPRESAPQQVQLWQGDALEVRGERLDWLQVYDHRRERAGFVRAAQVRRVGTDAGDAPGLLAVVRFLRDTPGSEALGIAYTAAYLRAAPAEALDAEPFDALGGMADRLARRASMRTAHAGDPALAAHLAVVAAYGVTLASHDRDGRVLLCYDGDAFRRVIAMTPSPEQRARASLGLTRHDCVDDGLSLADRLRVDEWRAQVLDRVDVAALPPLLGNRVLMRRAGVWSAVAFDRLRVGQPAGDASQRAIDALALVDARELAEGDTAVLADAAVRTGASRWAAEDPPATSTGKRLAVRTHAGQPGQTCVTLVDPRHDAAAPLLERCTYGVVWTASASVNAQGQALALAVQPLPTWRELWVFHRVKDRWVVDVLPPANGEPELGVVEFAGWLPDGTGMLAAREARVGTRFQRSFELLRLDTLAVRKRADSPAALGAFARWQDARWKEQNVIVRQVR